MALTDLIWLGLFSILGIVFILVMVTVMKSHRLIIRDPLNRKSYITTYFVTEKKDKDSGVLYWKSVFWQKRIKTPVPPSRAMEVGAKGRKYAEAYRISEDEYIWIEDQGLKVKDIIDEQTGKRKRMIYNVTKEGTLRKVDTFQPFSSTQRETIVAQYAKAQAVRNKKWTPEKVVALTSILGLVIIIVCLFIFWKDLAAPLLTMDARLEAREIRLIQLERDLCVGGNVQNVGSQQTGGVVQTGEKPPTT